MLRPLRKWTLSDLVYVGWAAVLAIACLTYWVPVVPLVCGFAAYLLFGMVQMFKRAGARMIEVRELQMVGLAAAWPLALRTDLFR